MVICTILAIKFVKPQNFDELQRSVTNSEQRTYIKLCVAMERQASVVVKDLTLALPRSHMSRTQIYNWYMDFKDGSRTDIEDRPRAGRPRETTDDENKELVKELIIESEGMTTQYLMYETDIPETSLRRILEEIGAKLVMSRYVPHLLTDQQKQARHAIAAKHLARYQREVGFLNRIVAIDETWIKSYDPKDPSLTKQWLLPGQKP